MSAVTDDFLYGYNADSDVLTRTNGLNSSFNEQYSYDDLHRLTSFTGPGTTQSWVLDAVGTWTTVTTNGSPQNRAFNSQNEMTGGPPPAYDNNGNTTFDLGLRGYIYDAWNRIVKVTTGGSTTKTYAYDA